MPQSFLQQSEPEPKPRMNPLRNNAKLPSAGLPATSSPLKQDIAPNAIRVALDALFPWSSAAHLRGRNRYPGIYAGGVALLGRKAKSDTLKDWRNGRRKAPRWFVAVLDAQNLRSKRNQSGKPVAPWRLTNLDAGMVMV